MSSIVLTETKVSAAIPLSGPVLTALGELCRRLHVRCLDLFGSALTERFDNTRSDLDLLVSFEDLPQGAYADAYFELHDGLELLFGRPVDLVTEVSLENPYFRRQVEASRRRLFPPE